MKTSVDDVRFILNCHHKYDGKLVCCLDGFDHEPIINLDGWAYNLYNSFKGKIGLVRRDNLYI